MGEELGGIGQPQCTQHALHVLLGVGGEVHSVLPGGLWVAAGRHGRDAGVPILPAAGWHHHPGLASVHGP
jgi:hypothetical protein